MEKIKKMISWAVPILCIATSVLVILYLLQCISNVWVVFIMPVLTFIVSVLNLIIIIKSREKR